MPPTQRPLLPLLSTTIALLVPWAVACNLVDDEPANPVDIGSGDGGQAACLEHAAEIQAECMLPLQFVSIYDQGGSTMIVADDPSVTVGVGPNAWLVQVSAEADYIGTYQFDGETCTVGCGLCQPGESLCHTGFDDEGLPECGLCIPWDTPNPGVECATFAASPACAGGADDGTDSGEGEQTDEDSGGADGTGSDDGFIDDEVPLEYDCAQWDPTGAVALDIRGNATVDAALVEEVAMHYGDPLADCDGIKFTQLSNGYFALSEMASTGLLAQMGLVPGDTIVAINGEKMSGLDAIAEMAIDLFLGSHITSRFTLTIGRGRSYIERTIRVR